MPIGARRGSIILPDPGRASFDRVVADGRWPFAGYPTIIKPTGHTTVTNSTTLVNVAGFAFTVEPNEEWIWRAVVVYAANTAPDIKIAWTWPSSPTSVYWTPVGWWTDVVAASATGHLTLNPISVSGSSAPIGGDGGLAICFVEGIIQNGANRGLVQMQFAQNVADAIGSIVYGTSWLLPQRVG